MIATAATTGQTFATLYKSVHEQWVMGTVADLTQAQADWMPTGTALPAGAQLAHIVTSEDFMINGMVAGGAPLAMSTFQGKTGLSELPAPGPWSDWARRVKIDLAALKDYAQAVFAASETVVAGLTESDLEKPIDLTAAGFGVMPTQIALQALILNGASHCGEISCLKGLQGAKGYPF